MSDEVARQADGALQILDDARAGVLTWEEALRDGEVLRGQFQTASAVLVAQDECRSAFKTAERAVVDREQAQYMEANPGFIAGIAESFTPDLELLTEMLAGG